MTSQAGADSSCKTVWEGWNRLVDQSPHPSSATCRRSSLPHAPRPPHGDPALLDPGCRACGGSPRRPCPQSSRRRSQPSTAFRVGGGVRGDFLLLGVFSLSQNDRQHWTGRQTPPNTALSGDTAQNGKLCFFNIYFYLLIFYLAAPVSVATRRIFSFGMWDPAP